MSHHFFSNTTIDISSAALAIIFFIEKDHLGEIPLTFDANTLKS